MLLSIRTGTFCFRFNSGDVCYKQIEIFQVYTEGGKPPGYDRVRSAEIGNKDFELEVMEEAYTTEHWLVRIYKVKDLRNRGV